jgi:hypothetical protein
MSNKTNTRRSVLLVAAFCGLVACAFAAAAHGAEQPTAPVRYTEVLYTVNPQTGTEAVYVVDTMTGMARRFAYSGVTQPAPAAPPTVTAPPAAPNGASAAPPVQQSPQSGYLMIRYHRCPTCLGYGAIQWPVGIAWPGVGPRKVIRRCPVCWGTGRVIL